MSCNSEEIQIPKSADQEFEIEIRDYENNALLDLSICAQIFIALCFADGTIIQKFSKVATTGWPQRINDDLAEFGTLRFKLDGSDTESLAEGKVYYETRLQFTDLSYSDSKDDKIVPKTYLFTLVDSITNGIL